MGKMLCCDKRTAQAPWSASPPPRVGATPGPQHGQRGRHTTSPHPPQTPLSPVQSCLPSACLSLMLLIPLPAFSGSHTHPSLLGEGQQWREEGEESGLRPHSLPGRTGAGGWGIGPQSSSLLPSSASLTPKVFQAAVARTFSSGFNAHNPEGLSGIFSITTLLPWSYFSKRETEPKLGWAGVTHESLGINQVQMSHCLPVCSTCQE